MTDVEDRLAEIEALADAATEGPWEYAADTLEILDTDGGIALMTWPGRNTPNAAFIAAARTDVPALTAALRAVLDECNGQIRASTARIRDVIAVVLDVTP